MFTIDSCKLDESYLSVTVKGLFLLAYQGHQHQFQLQFQQNQQPYILDTNIPNLYYRLLQSTLILPQSHLTLSLSLSSSNSSILQIKCQNNNSNSNRIKVGFASSFFFRHRY